MTTYADKLGSIVTSSFVGYALSMCKEMGILQVLVDAQTPLTSQEVADRKQLKERYVRELLNCLATAEVIQASLNESGVLVYHLEEDEKTVFRSPLMPFIAFLSSFTLVYNKVKRCLPTDGPNGTRYSDEVHNAIEELGAYNMDLFVESLLNRVDGLKEKLENGIEVIEVGCGRGRLLARFAQMFPKSTFVATDNVPRLLEQLRADLGHISNVRYEMIDLCSMPDQPAKQYDWVYCVDVIHDLPNPPSALKGIHKIIKAPGGIFTMIDISASGSPISDKGNFQVAAFYATSTFLCIPESFQREDSHALGACWGKQMAINLATNAGFKVTAIDLPPTFILYICKL